MRLATQNKSCAARVSSGSNRRINSVSSCQYTMRFLLLSSPSNDVVVVKSALEEMDDMMRMVMERSLGGGWLGNVYVWSVDGTSKCQQVSRSNHNLSE